MANKQDAIYASPLDEMIDFRFDERVVNVFPDMIQRSVPGYGTMISTIGILAARYAQKDSHCYDLGCSLGAVTLSMRQRITQANCDIIAIDNSVAMIERGQQLLASDHSSSIPVSMVCADLQNVDIDNEQLRKLQFDFVKLMQDYQVEHVVIRERMTRGKFIGGSVGFKLEAALQLADNIEVSLIAPSKIKDIVKRSHVVMNFSDTGLKQFQEPAFTTAFAYLDNL